MRAGKNRTEGFCKAGCFRGVKKARNIVLCFSFDRETFAMPVDNNILATYRTDVSTVLCLIVEYISVNLVVKSI